MTAPIRSMPELIAALKGRAQDLGLAYGTIDAVAGLPDRYTSKLFAPTPIKNLGPMSFEAILGALGVTVVLVEDQEQIARVQGRWTKRKRPLKPSPSITPSMQNEVPLQLQVTPALQRLIHNKEWMREIGLRGANVRNYRLSKRRRRMIAKKAANTRWNRERERVTASTSRDPTERGR